MAELNKKERTYKRADELRPRNDQQFPFAAGPSVGACIDAYHAEHVHRRKASTYYVTETLNQFMASNDIEENFPIACLEKWHCKNYKAHLLNGTLRRRRKPGPVTIARKLSCLHHFVKWCVNNDHLEHDIMAGVILPPRLVASAKTLKEGYTDTELEKIANNLHSFKLLGETVKLEFRWLILLLMHTGCRVTEVLQLLTTDVRQEEGIWFLDIVGTGEGRQLKNRASIRQVPIHSNLLKAGFLDWYKTVKDKRMFPVLFPYGAVKASLTFTRLLKKLKLKRPAVTLHSLRHTMTIKLERARVHYSIMRRLLGHTVGKDVESRVYLGSLQYSITELSAELEKVSFPVA
ncbi:MAG TPA: tyrosine-type recombinase/integrase [Nitrospiraceae bacterium]|jgi:integrase|nr:tyrosine-type recombinase/integrase [Nitrospiraceae bacterium]